MTTNDYHVTMESVRIAQLKARLSEFLRRVRAGESLTVLDRSTPIARIVPWAAPPTPLSTRRPRTGAGRPCDVDLPAPPPLDLDVVEVLLEDRAKGR